MRITGETIRTTALLTGVAAVALLLWWLAERERAALMPQPLSPPRIDSVALETETAIFATNGVLEQLLEAERVEHDRENGIMHLTGVRWESFRPPYHLVAYAQHADWIESERRLDASGTVRLRRDAADAQPLALASEALTLWPDESRAASTLPTWLLQETQWAYGDTFAAEENLTRVHLIGHAHVYWPPPNETTPRTERGTPSAKSSARARR